MSDPVAWELQVMNAHLAKIAQSLQWFDELLRERREQESRSQWPTPAGPYVLADGMSVRSVGKK